MSNNIHILAQRKAKIKKKEKISALKITISVTKKNLLSQKFKEYQMSKKNLHNQKIINNFKINKKITEINNNNFKISKRIRFLTLKLVKKINKKLHFKKTLKYYSKNNNKKIYQYQKIWRN